MNGLLKAALGLLRTGKPVFPVCWTNRRGLCIPDGRQCKHPGKVPLVQWKKYQDQLPTEKEVSQWWKKWPSANIAMPTGHLSSNIVIDCDSELAVKRFLKSYPEANNTRLVRTGNGGQFYFNTKADIRNDTGKLLGPKIDVRGQGGYVIIPPSVHRSGKPYRWINKNKPIPLPKRLKNILSNHSKTGRPSNASHKSKRIGKRIPESTRNTSLTALAGAMRSRGMCEDAILAALQAENAAKCDPPLEVDEVGYIAKSIAKYDPNTTTENLTDAGNARKFVARYGHGLHYCYQTGNWIVWDETRWKEDKTGEVMRRAKETVRNIYIEAYNSADEKERKDLASHAKKSEGESRLRAMVKLAESEPTIPVTTDQFDSNPYLLNLLNGTLNLKTGKLQPHRREDLLTKICPVEYNPKAKYRIWKSFLNRIMNGDENLIQYLQKAVGYALTGDTREQVLFIFYGTGANGKTTFISTIMSMLGDYARSTPTETLLVNQGNRIPNDIARLKGARFVPAVEAEGGRHLAETLVKQITGGDAISARFLYGEYFDFHPQFKIFLAVNNKPIIRGTDLAIWRRIHLILFDVTIPTEQQDKDLLEKLKKELPGVLNWAVEGCLRWQGEGLGNPIPIEKATNKYRDEMDPVGRFLKDCCILDSKQRVIKRQFYNSYTEWCESNGEEQLNQFNLRQHLTKHGISEGRNNRTRYWEGVGLDSKKRW